jgi:hypothetical protein
MRPLSIIGAVFFCAATLPTTAADRGICIKGDLGVAGVAAGTCLAAGQAASLLDAQVTDAKGKPHSAEMMMSNQRKTVETCREYNAAESEGWSSANERFHRVCEPVTMLSGAQVASQSFLRAGDEDLRDLTRLTALALPGMGDIDPMAAPDMRSAEDFRKAGSFEVKDVEGVSLAIRRNRLDTTFRELARADVDNDGIEDLLIERKEDMGGGNSDAVFMLLTRIEKNGMLVLNDSFGG